MIKLILLLVVLLLSACAQPVNDHQEVTNNGLPTPETTADNLQELKFEAVKSSFSSGSHSVQLSCETCHSVNGGLVEKELSWLNETTQQEESISSSTELCSKCHPDQNKPQRVGSSTELAHADAECITCHNPHSTQASCTQSSCHLDIRNIITADVDVPEFHPTSDQTNSNMCGGSSCHGRAKQALASPIYHQPVHRQVPCYVCHDRSGLVTGSDGNGSWYTNRSITPEVNSHRGEVVSHQIGRDVDCTKCHYADNPWELLDQVTSN